ncbi:hypothetical protein SM021_004012 [Cronobacter muytjensii]|nr:hypothetical protein [Cronobacter muytjensii]
MEFFYLVRATQKSKKPHAVFWFTDKTETRAKLRAQVILEDAGIEVGRGHDYQLPVNTHFPVENDLPEEGAVDFTWCDRYELADDGRTWLPKAKPAKSTSIREEHAALASGDAEPGCAVERPDYPYAHSKGEPVKTSSLPFRTRVAAFYRGSLFTVVPEEIADAQLAEMDTENTYLQNLMLAAGSVEPLKHCYDHVLKGVIDATLEVWPKDGKAPDLNSVLSFMQEMVDPAKNRDEVKAKWLKRANKAAIKRTDKGTNAGGNMLTDRGEGVEITLDLLDLETAAALQPGNFDIYHTPGGIVRRAKEMIRLKESPWKEWSTLLRSTPGILDHSRAAIYALIRQAPENIHLTPAAHREYITRNLVMGDPAKPSADLLAQAGHLPAAPQPKTKTDVLEKPQNDDCNPAQDEQPKIENIGGGVFSVEGLTGGQEKPAVADAGATYKEEKADEKEATGEPAEDNPAQQELSPREREICTEVEFALAGKADQFRAEEVAKMIEATGEEVSLLAFLITLDIWGLEQEQPEPFTKEDIHHFTLALLDEWSSNHETRFDRLCAIYREHQWFKEGDTESAGTDAHGGSQELQQQDTAPAFSCALTYRQQLTLAALQGLCANPVHGRAIDELAMMASDIADRVLQHQEGAGHE